MAQTGGLVVAGPQNLKDYPNVAEKMLNMAEWGCA